MVNRIARAILTVFLCVVLAGFGLCGAYGTLLGAGSLFDVPGVGESEYGQVLIVFGLAGLLIAFGCWKALAALRRSRTKHMP